jgi:hypothetical protein
MHGKGEKMVSSHLIVVLGCKRGETRSFVNFLRVTVCWPLLCLCRQFCIFERCLDSIRAAVASRCATNLATHLHKLSHPVLIWIFGTWKFWISQHMKAHRLAICKSHDFTLMNGWTSEKTQAKCYLPTPPCVYYLAEAGSILPVFADEYSSLAKATYSIRACFFKVHSMFLLTILFIVAENVYAL